MTTDNILLSSARSGTNFFLTVYSKCFPQDFVANEIFRNQFDSLDLLSDLLELPQDEIKPIAKSDPVRLWQMVVAACEARDCNALVKIFYYHASRAPELWDHIRDHSKIVHLIRRNPFNAFLSHKLAQETGTWVAYDSKSDVDKPMPRIALDAEELDAFILQQKEHVAWARSTFAQADFTEVFYEDIAGSTEDCAAEVERIFGPPRIKKKPFVLIKKLKKEANKDIVSNYQEVQQYDRPVF